MSDFFERNLPDTPGPDFSEVDSQSKAEELFRRGCLEKLLLLPLEFGGEDILNNVLYVPIGIAAIKARIDLNIIAPLVSEGKISQYRAVPQYQGESFIPIAVTVSAWDPGQFTSTITIWGEALKLKDG
jgi:hypothetical protein